MVAHRAHCGSRDPAALDQTATQNSEDFSGRSSRTGRNCFHRERVPVSRVWRGAAVESRSLSSHGIRTCLAGEVVALDSGAQPFPENPTHFAHGLRDGGQRRRARAHPSVVVEADQRDVSRHAKAAFGDRRQRRQRREIRQRLYRRRRRIVARTIPRAFRIAASISKPNSMIAGSGRPCDRKTSVAPSQR